MRILKSLILGLTGLALALVAWMALQGAMHTQASLPQQQAAETLLSMHFEGDVLDASGNGLHGTWPNGGERYVAGHSGQAIDVSTADDNYVRVAHDARLGGMERLTVAVWAKKNDPDVGGYLVVKHSQYRIAIGDNYVACHLGNSDGAAIYPSRYNLAAIHDTAWHHYVLTYDGNVARLFVDGVLLGTRPFSGTIMSAASHPLHIGKNPFGSALAFDGQIDELEISADAPDLDPPYTSDHDPAPGAGWVSPDTHIVARVRDDGKGVLPTAITMTVQGAVVAPTITGVITDYTVTYTPAAPFAYGQVVDVTIAAVDVDGNRLEEAYAFTIRAETDQIPPRGYFYFDDTGAVHTAIHAFFYDHESGMGPGAQMRFSNDTIAWSEAQPYTHTTAWTLAAPAGERTVYAQVADAAGNWTAVMSYTLGIVYADDLVAHTNAPGAVRLTWQERAGVSEYAILRSDRLGWRGAVPLLADVGPGDATISVASTNGLLPGDEFHFRDRGEAYYVVEVLDAQRLVMTPTAVMTYLVQVHPVSLSGAWVKDYTGYTQIATVTNGIEYLDVGLDMEQDYYYVVGYRQGGALLGYSNPVHVRSNQDGLWYDAALASNGGYAWRVIRYYGDTPELIDGNPAAFRRDIAYNNPALRARGVHRFGSHRVELDAFTPIEYVEISQDVSAPRVRATLVRLGFSDRSFLQFDLERDPSIVRMKQGNYRIYRIPVHKTTSYVVFLIEDIANEAGDFTQWNRVSAHTRHWIESPVTSTVLFDTSDVTVDFSQPDGALPTLFGTDEVWNNVAGQETGYMLNSWADAQDIFDIYRVQVGDFWPHQYAHDIIKIGELANDVTALDTTLALMNTTPYLERLPTGGRINVGYELLVSESRSDHTLTVRRGEDRTRPAAYAAGAPVYAYRNAGQILRLQEAIPEFPVVKYPHAYVSGITPINDSVPLNDPARTAILTITVNAGSYVAGDVIRIGREAFLVLGVDDANPAQVRLTARRGFDGTVDTHIQHNYPTADVYKLLNYETYYEGFKNDPSAYDNYYWDHIKTTFDKVILEGDATPWIIAWGTWYATQARGQVAALETITNARGIENNVLVDAYNATHDDADWWTYIQPGNDPHDDAQIAGNMYQFYHANIHMLTGEAAGKVFYVRSHTGDRLRVVPTWDDSSWPVTNPEYIDLYAEGVRPGDTYIVSHRAHRYGNVAPKYFEYNAAIFYNVVRFIRETYADELADRPIYIEYYLEPNLGNYGTWTKEAYIDSYNVFVDTIRNGSAALGPGFGKDEVIIGAGAVAGGFNPGVKVSGEVGDYDFALSLIEETQYLDFLSFHYYYMGERMIKRGLSWETQMLRQYARSLGKEIAIIDSEGNVASASGTGHENAIHRADISVPYWPFNLIHSYSGDYGEMGRLDFLFHFRQYASSNRGFGMFIEGEDGDALYDLVYWPVKLYRDHTSKDRHAPDTLVRVTPWTDKYSWTHVMGAIHGQTGAKKIHLINRKHDPVTVNLTLLGVEWSGATMDSIIGCGPNQTIDDGYHPPDLEGVVVTTHLDDVNLLVLEPCSANIITLQEETTLALRGAPGDETIYLDWEVRGTLPAGTTWDIHYQREGGSLVVPAASGLISGTRAYSITGLTNGVWYSVTLNGMLDGSSFLTDTARVMPTDRFIYLPLITR
ncbi:MAG TPA: hypothetical protein ENN19_04835 [Chloroflexi bacterium]|nr:hypothetical protein [Chloroflexota bacterium]